MSRKTSPFLYFLNNSVENEPISYLFIEDFHATTEKVTYLALVPLAPLDSAYWNLPDI